MKKYFPRYLVGIMASLVAACAGTPSAPERIVVSDDGLSSLALPGHWGRQTSLNSSATQQVADETREAYLVVITEEDDSVSPDGLAAYAKSVVQSIAENLQGARVEDPRNITINQQQARQTKISGSMGDVDITYLSTVVVGKSGYYHLIAWTLSDYWGMNAGLLKSITNSFQELAVPQPRKKRVELTFNWPSNIDATVSYSSTEDKDGKNKSLKVAYDMKVAPKGEYYLVQSLNLKSSFSASGGGEQEKMFTELLSSLAANNPEYLVSSSGEFITAESMDQFMATIDEIIENAAARLKDQEVMEKFKEVIRPMVTKEFFLTQMTEEWDSKVGRWSDAVLLEGETFVSNSSYYVPSLGEETYPMIHTTQLDGLVPCTRENRQYECVRIKEEQHVRSEKMRKAMQTYLRGMARLNVKVKDMHIVKTTLITTEKDTLLPHVVTTETVTTVDLEIQGSRKTTRNRENVEMIYSYKRTSGDPL